MTAREPESNRSTDMAYVAERAGGGDATVGAEGLRVLVCGGRDFHDMGAVVAALDAVQAETPVSFIIEGGAAGADQCAYRWAVNNGLSHRTYRADWAMHGRAAGPIRNEAMLRDGNPDLVVAFPGGRGTAHMIATARKRGIKVWEPLTDGALGRHDGTATPHNGKPT